MENSQVFLAFALPFSMLPLLMMTNSEVEMGEFKNRLWVKICGWISVIALTFLNLYNLPSTYEGFGIWSKGLSDVLAYITIIAILVLLLWTCIELYRGDKRFAAEGRGFGQKEAAKEAAMEGAKTKEND